MRETPEKGAAATAGEKASGAVARMWVGPIGERDGRRFTRGHKRQSLRPALGPYSIEKITVTAERKMIGGKILHLDVRFVLDQNVYTYQSYITT